MSANDHVQGEITVSEDLLLIRFPYSKLRFNQIKSLKEARYDKVRRCWSLPIDQLDRLKKLKSFSENQIFYNFDQAIIANTVVALEQVRSQAIDRIKDNPFVVSKQDYEAARVPLVFKLSQNGLAIKASVRRGSRIKISPKDLPGVFFDASNKEYNLPTILLNNFLKQLRENQVLFAVDQELGQNLQTTATLRTAIIQGRHQPAWQELRACLLTPYVKEVSNRNSVPRFGIFEWNSHQLRLILPDISNFNDRKQKSVSFDQKELLELIEQSYLHGVHIWLDRNVLDYIKQNYSREISESTSTTTQIMSAAYLTALQPEICWMAAQGDALQLLISKVSQLLTPEFYTKLYSMGFTKVEYPIHSWAESFSVAEIDALKSSSSLSELCQTVGRTIHISLTAKKIFKQLELRQASLERQARYQQLQNCKLPELNSELEQRLFAHQRVGIAWLQECEHGLLGDDMGLGKTLTVLTAFYLLRQKKVVDFICVICPRSLVNNWINESQNWFKDLRLIGLPDSKAKQAKFFRNFEPALHASGLVMNFETYRLARIFPELVKIAHKNKVLLVIDESQRVKNPQSQAFKALAELAAKCPRRILMTGTPIPNDLSDIWAQMFLLDQGERLGPNYYDWLTCVAELGNKWSEYAVKSYRPEQVGKVRRRVQEVLLRRRKEEVVDLPPKIFTTRNLELTGSQLERYEEIRQELLLRVSNMAGEQHVKEISSVLEEFLRAVQIASNPRLVDPHWKGEPVKFIELDEIVKEVVEGQAGKVVIWTNFVNNVKELLNRYSAYGSSAIYGDIKAAQRSAVIEDFQSNKPNSARVLIAIPAAGGVGITLTAAKTAVYVDKTWNAEHWLQSVDRIHRIGQTGTVSIISLNACLIDMLIARNLKNKYFKQKELIDQGIVTDIDVMPTRQDLLDALG